MQTAETLSYPVSIFIAGWLCDAYKEARAYCDKVGLCVTVSAAEYIYTGGSESGVIVGLINYPRFPSTPDAIWEHAEALGERLRRALGQDSYTIQASDKTVWFSHREQTP